MIETRGRNHKGPIPPKWRVGSLVPRRGASRCYRCRRPWWATPGSHTLWYRGNGHGNSDGQIALCENCWAASSPTQRAAAHHWVTVWYWAPEGVSDDLLAVLEAARNSD